MSLQIVKNGKRRVVMIADGSAVHEDGSYQSDVPKLWPAGDFSAVGTYNLTDFKPGDEIADYMTQLCSNRKLRDHPVAFLNALANEFRPRLARTIADNPQGHAWHLRTSSILFGAVHIYRNPVNGGVTVLELQFCCARVDGALRLDEPTITEHLKDHQYTATFSVVPELPGIPERSGERPFFPFLELRPDDADDVVIDSVDKMLAEFKRKHEISDGTMAGVIEIAAIDSRGFSWLRCDRMKRNPIGRTRRKLSRIAEEIRLRWNARPKRAA